VAASQDPASGDILYGVAAISDSDVWAVGGQQDSAGVWHPLIEHWDGHSWTVTPAADPNGGGNVLYGITAASRSSAYAVGQTGTAFPGKALVEHWNGRSWSVDSTLTSPGESLVPFAVTGGDGSLTLVGERETDITPFKTFVAAGSPLSLQDAPSVGSGENDLFGAARTADGTTWAVGWNVDPASGNFATLTESSNGGTWSVVPSPNPGTGDNGLAGIAAIPGGGLWAVGTATDNGAPTTLVEYHP
jgi:hypothetical protein